MFHGDGTRNGRVLSLLDIEINIIARNVSTEQVIEALELAQSMGDFEINVNVTGEYDGEEKERQER